MPGRAENLQRPQRPSLLWNDLVCVECAATLSSFAENPDLLVCGECSQEFRIVNGIPRMLNGSAADATQTSGRSRDQTLQTKTAASFGFEWTHFSEMYPEWESNFRDYMFPHPPEFFRGKKVLDAGCGIGRHACYAALYGAQVSAVDISQAVEVAARNTMHRGVRVIQADLLRLPFKAESFDLVYSMGVLHHLADTEQAMQYLLNFVKPGGEFRMFLYWAPEGQPLKGLLLKAVTALRRVAIRIPHRVLYPISYLAGAGVWAGFVWPYRALRQFRRLEKYADRLPLRQYSRYPFRTCVNDQFDRLSAPLERRYSRNQVEQLLNAAGLDDLAIFPNFGWVAYGKKPGRQNVAA